MAHCYFTTYKLERKGGRRRSIVLRNNSSFQNSTRDASTCGRKYLIR